MGDMNGRFGLLNQIPEIAPGINNKNLSDTRESNDRKINKRGELLNETFEFFGYKLLNGRSKGDNPANFTFVGSQGKSVIDVAWVNDTAAVDVVDFDVLYNLFVSDHLPCRIKLLGPKVLHKHAITPLNKVKKMRWDQTKADEYANYISQELRSSRTNYSIDELTTTIKNAGKNLEMEILYQPKIQTLQRNPWFNLKCNELKREVKKAARALKNDNLNSEKTVRYQQLRKKYLASLKEAKLKYEEKIKSALVNVKDNITFWNTIKSIKPRSNNENSVGLATWQNHLKNLQNITTLHTEPSAVPELMIRDEILDSPIELPEIYAALRKMKPKKCPGQDGITNEFLTNLPTAAILKIQEVFNDVLTNRTWSDDWTYSDIKMLFKKGNPEDPQNYRPIALENCSFKLLTSILSQRLNKWANIHDAIPEYQNGFRPGRGCIDNIFVLNSIIEITINQSENNALFAAFIDFKGAFDSVKHNILWNHLNSIKISTNFILILKEIYTRAKIRIVTPNGETDWIAVIIGLLQGDPMSPPLFNLFTNDLESFFRQRGFRGIKISETVDVILLAYADDVVVLSKSIIDLKDKLATLEDYCKNKQLKINVNKTKIMIFKKRINKRLYQNFELDKNKIEIVNEFKYLGFTFYRTGSFKMEVDNRIAAANLAFNNLQNIVGNGKIGSWETKKILINSMVESVMLYGSEIWGVRSIEKITAAHLRFFKRLFYLPINTPGYSIIHELNIEPIELKIIKRSVNWWKKLLKAPDNSLIKSCYNRLLEEQNCETNWTTSFKEYTFPNDLESVWQGQSIRANDETNIIDFHISRLKSELFSKINESSSLCWYKELVNLNGQNTQNYLHLDLAKSTINTFCQTRLLNRYNEKIYVNGMSYKFYNNELCTICNHHEHDTLLHLLTKCNITESFRKHYLIDENPEHPEDPEECLKRLLRIETKENVTKMVNFIKQSLRIRSFILCE
jgi:hypothetical protein